MAKKSVPVYPGEILLEEFLKPLGVSQYRLAHDIGVPPRRINEIVHSKRAISADTALRLSRYFGLSEQFWINLQPTMSGSREGSIGRAAGTRGARTGQQSGSLDVW